MSPVAERIAELFSDAWSGHRQIEKFVAPGDTVLARFPGMGQAGVRIA